MNYSLKNKEFDITGPDENDPPAALLCAKPVDTKGLPHGQKYYLQLLTTDCEDLGFGIVVPNHDDQEILTHYFETEIEALLWIRDYMVERYGAIARHVELPPYDDIDWTQARKMDWGPTPDMSTQMH